MAALDHGGVAECYIVAVRFARMCAVRRDSAAKRAPLLKHSCQCQRALSALTLLQIRRSHDLGHHLHPRHRARSGPLLPPVSASSLALEARPHPTCFKHVPSGPAVSQVSDGIVTAAFLRQARNFGKFEECTFSRNASYVFAGLSFILIFTPLLLTAVFIARTLMRDYVRRRLSEAQKNVARSDNGAFDGLGQSHGDDSGTLPLRGEQGEWGGGASQTGALTPSPSFCPRYGTQAGAAQPHRVAGP